MRKCGINGIAIITRICNYVFCCPTGISEGSPLSPSMSNIYLYYFDEAMSNLPVTFYIRYCDDILFLSNIKPAELYPYVENYLCYYGLTVSADKLDIGFVTEGLNYLGYVVHNGGISIQLEKVAEIVDKLHTAHSRKKREQIAKALKLITEAPYFCLSARHASII